MSLISKPENGNGSSNAAIIIVTRGTGEIILPRANQSDVVILQLGPGKVFGEMTFFHERKRLARAAGLAPDGPRYTALRVIRRRASSS